MPSSRIAPLTDALTHSWAPSWERVTVGDRRSPLDALESVQDPRRPQGVRYRLASLLAVAVAVAVCAVLAGAVTPQAIVD